MWYFTFMPSQGIHSPGDKRCCWNLVSPSWWLFCACNANNHFSLRTRHTHQKKNGRHSNSMATWHSRSAVILCSTTLGSSEVPSFGWTSWSPTQHSGRGVIHVFDKDTGWKFCILTRTRGQEKQMFNHGFILWAAAKVEMQYSTGLTKQLAKEQRPSPDE